MFKVRIEKLRKKITQLGLDAFLVMAPENRRYLVVLPEVPEYY